MGCGGSKAPPVEEGAGTPGAIKKQSQNGGAPTEQQKDEAAALLQAAAAEYSQKKVSEDEANEAIALMQNSVADYLEKKHEHDGEGKNPVEKVGDWFKNLGATVKDRALPLQALQAE